VGAALALAVHRVALARLGDPTAAWLLGAAALFYKPWLDAVLYDFHPELLFPVTLLAAYLAATRGAGAVAYWTLIALSLSIKEDMALYVVGFGLLMAWLLPAARRRALATVAVSVLWFVLVLGVVIPALRAGSGLPADYVYASLWSHLGDSLPEVAWRAVSDPGAVVQGVDLRRTVGAIVSMLGPLLLLPLGSRWVLGALIPLGVLATSSSPVMQGLGLHYAAPLIGFAWLATIETLRWLGQRPVDAGADSGFLSRLRGRSGLVAAVAAVVLVVCLASTRWSVVRPRSYAGLAERAAVLEALAALPGDASVAAQSSLLPHVPKRWGMRMLPTIDESEYVLLDTALNPWPLSGQELHALRADLIRRDFEVIVARDAVMLLRRP